MQQPIPPDHLEIHQAKNEEAYRDIVRIPEDVRLDAAGARIDEGRICKLKTGSKTAYVIVRGVKNLELAKSPEHIHGRCIHMDEVTRKRLNVDKAGSAKFILEPVGWWGEFRWAWSATEIGYRVASRLGLLGLVLGIIAFLPELIRWTSELSRWIQEHL
jgi:hypothetical protein